ncbi:LysE family translocator [Labrys sp. KNU-23]|uniref:LysE family translocator n=1 Tax=Labrys sp. KNU-23 TaxID=2789216 RepID=UPI0011EBE2E8|nr:LysE family translocator [Labrys sp. KNU-23]QEN85457.1 LysE family translocator [Labrys sp. KNU-23]
MTSDLLIAFVIYAFVTSITPGPNNTMLLTSGANYGLKATMPHLLGINLGFCVLVLAAGFGIGGLFSAFPLLHTLLRYGGAAYLLYLAWKIARAGGPNAEGGRDSPMTFFQAAAFQWVNPKAWIMAIGAITTYTPGNGFFGNVLAVAAIYVLVNAPCLLVWAAAGTALRGFLSKPLRLRLFNIVMALALVASLYPILAEAGS